MSKSALTDYFHGVAAKYLSQVDANPRTSNQHEIGGLVVAGFKNLLGDGKETYHYKCTYVYIDDENDVPVICKDNASWYNARRDNPKRSAEYRLYYQSNPATELMSAGDFFLIAKRQDNSLLIVITPPESSTEYQLRGLFQISTVTDKFSKVTLNETELLFPVKMLLDELEVPIEQPSLDDDFYLKQMLEQFPNGFPPTLQFTHFALDTLPDKFNASEAPDQLLMAALEHEEYLFRLYERYLVKDRLQQGFGDDIDSFIKYSLSIQNRRKSRVGHAFEHHLSSIFSQCDIQFEQAKKAGQVTENKSKPDFIFPSFKDYHDPRFPNSKLRILGAKTSCKDRWRQVLSEADKVENKHLITLQSGISIHQTNEMQSKYLQLVVPQDAQYAYTEEQKSWLLNLSEFIQEIRKLQKNS